MISKFIKLYWWITKTFVKQKKLDTKSTYCMISFLSSKIIYYNEKNHSDYIRIYRLEGGTGKDVGYMVLCICKSCQISYFLWNSLHVNILIKSMMQLWICQEGKMIYATLLCFHVIYIFFLKLTLKLLYRKAFQNNVNLYLKSEL